MFILRFQKIRQAARKMLGVITRVGLDTDYELSNVSHTCNTPALFSSSTQYGYQQTHQQCNHSNDNEQFNQGESNPVSSKTHSYTLFATF